MLSVLLASMLGIDVAYPTWAFAGGSSAHALSSYAFADLDGDGDLDCAATSKPVGLVLLFRNEGDRRMTLIGTLDLGAYEVNGWQVDLLDMNDDTTLDVIARSSEDTRVFYGVAGNGGWSAPVILEGPVEWFAIADMNAESPNDLRPVDRESRIIEARAARGVQRWSGGAT